MACDGVCERYRHRSNGRRISKYIQGAKRCMICELFVQWEGKYCPCCGQRLRCKPRTAAGRAAYNKAQKTLQIPLVMNK